MRGFFKNLIWILIVLAWTSCASSGPEHFLFPQTESDGTSTADTTPSVSSSSYSRKSVSLSSMSLNINSLNLKFGQLGKISVTATLSNGKTYKKLSSELRTAYGVNGAIQWFSDNENIVSVSSRGGLTAVGVGTTTVKASLGNFSDLVTVAVTETEDTLESLAFHQTYSQVSQATPLTLTFDAEFSASGRLGNLTVEELRERTDCTLGLSSSNSHVAIIDNTATFVPIANGTTTFTTSCNDFTLTFPLTVKALPDTYVPEVTETLETISLDISVDEVMLGDTTSWTCDLAFENGTVTDVTDGFVSPSGGIDNVIWESSDESVVTIENGQIEFVGLGTATITVSYQDLSASTTITVKEHSEEPLDTSNSFLSENDDFTLTLGDDGGEGSGSDVFPDIVYGAPQNSLTDTVSIGKGGEVLIELGDYVIVDGPGTDFTIFENTFTGWAEPAFVSVSEDGMDYYTYACDPFDPSEIYSGCAGVQTVNYSSDSSTYLNPEISGGDQFDLDETGLSHIKYIKITDGETCTNSFVCVADKVGFDLDAMAIVNGVNE